MPPTNATAATPAPAAAAPAEAKQKRARSTDMSEEDRQNRCIELINELYAADGSTEDGAKTKRGVRAKLRNLDKNWTQTHADYISTNFPERNKRVGESSEVEAEAPSATAAAPVTAAPAAAKPKAKKAPATA